MRAKEEAGAVWPVFKQEADMKANIQANSGQTQTKKVITSGSLPDAVADMFAAILVEFILQEEQEGKRGKEKSA